MARKHLHERPRRLQEDRHENAESLNSGLSTPESASILLSLVFVLARTQALH